MAQWAGYNLPAGSVVYSRKPRLFYAFSGLPSVTYPFTTDGRSLLDQADSLGVGYVMRSNWDRADLLYVDPVIADSPDRFCVVNQLWSGSGSPTSLLAILPPRADDFRDPADTLPDLTACPLPGRNPYPSIPGLLSMTVPILDR